MAGGCKDWCVEHPPMSSAEMYDPATNTWTQLPDLPMSISGGRMEQLNGKPTLIGGATPWARGNKNVKKPQIQMCMSCRKT